MSLQDTCAVFACRAPFGVCERKRRLNSVTRWKFSISPFTRSCSNRHSTNVRLTYNSCTHTARPSDRKTLRVPGYWSRCVEGRAVARSCLQGLHGSRTSCGSAAVERQSALLSYAIHNVILVSELDSARARRTKASKCGFGACTAINLGRI